MADKKVYRNIKNSAGTVVSLFDSHTNKFIPLDPDNADYQLHLVLVAQGRGLVLDAGQALPDGVTDADVRPLNP